MEPYKVPAYDSAFILKSKFWGLAAQQLEYVRNRHGLFKSPRHRSQIKVKRKIMWSGARSRLVGSRLKERKFLLEIACTNHGNPMGSRV